MKSAAPHIAALLYTAPWALLPQHHGILAGHYRAWLKGDIAPRAKAAGTPATDAAAPAASCEPEGRERVRTVTLDTDDAIGLAVISINGYIGHRLGDFEADCFECCDLADLRRAIAMVDARPALTRVIFRICSPGGTTNGLPEAAMDILRLGDTRETIAYVDDQCCSAAYWLASACATIVAQPSAYVGSIGVYVAALDDTRAWEMEGYSLKLWRDGTLKGMGHPGKGWTPEEEAYMREQVAWWSSQFKGFVRFRRAGIQDDAMQGQAYPAAAAPAGVLDALASSFDEFLLSLF